MTTPEPYTVGDGPCAIVAYDFGIKRTILRHLAGLGPGRRGAGLDDRQPTCWPASPTGCSCPTVPATRPRCPTPPGDPATCSVGVPIFGICLGHQLLGRALGGETVKLPFGHHGANHPVKDLTTGAIEITSQNHNFAVDHRLAAGRSST